MCMVDLSKALMYEFHYDYIKNKYGNKSRKLFKDTGSLLYEIETENVYDNFSYNKKCLVLLFTMLSQNITIIQTHYSWLNEI